MTQAAQCAVCGKPSQLIQLVNGPAICVDCDRNRREEEKYV